MRRARLIKHGEPVECTATAKVLPPSLVQTNDARQVINDWLREHERQSRANPRAAFAALFRPPVAE